MYPLNFSFSISPGTPAPVIRWMKDGNEMSSDSYDSDPAKYKLSPSGSLIVYNVSKVDEGMYECVADNGRERRTARALFTIRDQEYETRPPTFGDDYVLVALEQASTDVSKALNATVQSLFDPNSGKNATPMELLRVFRYPASNEREVARAAEIYERTLELVANHVKDHGEEYAGLKLGDFTYEDLISPSNLELIGNLSGCEAHRAKREINCTDMCFHSKYRSIDGSCNNFAKPLQGASLTSFKRELRAEYENGFNSPIGNWINMKFFSERLEKIFSLQVGTRRNYIMDSPSPVPGTFRTS